MLRTATIFLQELLRRRQEKIPVGISWASVIVTDVALVGAGLLATLQRSAGDQPVALAALAVGMSPLLIFVFFNTKISPVLIGLSATTATAIYLFATATPIPSDIAPSLVVLAVLVVTTLTNAGGGGLAAGCAAALLMTAAALGRLDAVAVYLVLLAGAWVLGYLMNIQRVLLAEQIRAQKAHAELAAADERRRIAREVHDVIAHSLSITLLHVTGARRVLQQDRDVDDAVEALEQAERLGRQAMADIRRTVGLLDGAGPLRTVPEPGIDDIGALIQDFAQAGLDVTLSSAGPTRHVSGAVGLALYRIAQESLANVAKHAPDSKSTVELEFSDHSARLAVHNRLPATVAAAAAPDGRGLRGMRQRVELLGGAIEAGPSRDGWSVYAEIPFDDGYTGWRPWWCPSRGNG